MSGIIIAVFCAVLVLWYLASCFTFGKEGTGKIILRFGGYHKTLLVKKNHKLDFNENIVRLEPDELPDYPEWMGGLRFVSFLMPLGIDRVLSRDMKFQQSGENGIEDRDVKNVSDFLAGVDCPYAVPFLECYDLNNIPIDGHGTMVGRSENLYKSYYETTNFYAQAIGLVLPAVRKCFKTRYSFTPEPGEDPITQQDLDTFIWEHLSDPDINKQPGSNLSVVDELRTKYGFVLVAFRVALIKPPAIVVDKATKKWEAQMNKEAAIPQADADFERVYGPLQRAKQAGISEAAAAELRSQDLAGDNFSYDKTKIDVTSADEKIDPNFAGMIAGAKAVLGGSRQNSGRKFCDSGKSKVEKTGDRDRDQSSSPSAQKNQPKPPKKELTDEEIEKELDL